MGNETRDRWGDETGKKTNPADGAEPFRQEIAGGPEQKQVESAGGASPAPSDAATAHLVGAGPVFAAAKIPLPVGDGGTKTPGGGISGGGRDTTPGSFWGLVGDQGTRDTPRTPDKVPPPIDPAKAMQEVRQVTPVPESTNVKVTTDQGTVNGLTVRRDGQDFVRTPNGDFLLKKEGNNLQLQPVDATGKPSGSPRPVTEVTYPGREQGPVAPDSGRETGTGPAGKPTPGFEQPRGVKGGEPGSTGAPWKPAGHGPGYEQSGGEHPTQQRPGGGAGQDMHGSGAGGDMRGRGVLPGAQPEHGHTWGTWGGGLLGGAGDRGRTGGGGDPQAGKQPLEQGGKQPVEQGGRQAEQAWKPGDKTLGAPGGDTGRGGPAYLNNPRDFYETWKSADPLLRQQMARELQERGLHNDKGFADAVRQAARVDGNAGKAIFEDIKQGMRNPEAIVKTAGAPPPSRLEPPGVKPSPLPEGVRAPGGRGTGGGGGGDIPIFGGIPAKGGGGRGSREGGEAGAKAGKGEAGAERGGKAGKGEVAAESGGRSGKGIKGEAETTGKGGRGERGSEPGLKGDRGEGTGKGPRQIDDKGPRGTEGTRGPRDGLGLSPGIGKGPEIKLPEGRKPGDKGQEGKQPQGRGPEGAGGDKQGDKQGDKRVPADKAPGKPEGKPEGKDGKVKEAEPPGKPGEKPGEKPVPRLDPLIKLTDKFILNLAEPRDRKLMIELIDRVKSNKLEDLTANQRQLADKLKGLKPDQLDQLRILLQDLDKRGGRPGSEAGIIDKIRDLLGIKGDKGAGDRGGDKHAGDRRGIERGGKPDLTERIARAPKDVAERLLDFLKINKELLSRVAEGDRSRVVLKELAALLKDLNKELGLKPGKRGLTLTDIVAESPGGAIRKLEARLRPWQELSLDKALFAPKREAVVFTARLTPEQAATLKTIAARLEAKPSGATDSSARLAQQIGKQPDVKAGDIAGGDTGARGTRAEEPTAKGEAKGKETATRAEPPRKELAGKILDSSVLPSLDLAGQVRKPADSAGTKEIEDATTGNIEVIDREDTEVERERETKKEDEEKTEPAEAALANLAARKRKELDEREEKEQPEKAKKDREQSRQRQRYLVKVGDTLESIAMRMLRNRSLAPLIFEINQKIIPVRIEEGKKVIELRAGSFLWLPSAADIEHYRPGFTPVGAAQLRHVPARFESGKKWSTPEEELAARFGGKPEDYAEHKPYLRAKYTVRLGDTLKSIAIRHPSTQDVGLWKLIAEINGLSTEVDAKGTPLASLTRGSVIELPTAQEIADFRKEQPARRNVAAGQRLTTDLTGSRDRMDQLSNAPVADKSDEQPGQVKRESAVAAPPLPTDHLSNAPVADKSDEQPGQVKRESAIAAPPLPFEAAHEVTQLNDYCRLVTQAIASEEDGTSFRLEILDGDSWLPAVVYELRADSAARYEFTRDRKRRILQIDLPLSAVRELAATDLAANWQTYCGNFLAGRSPTGD